MMWLEIGIRTVIWLWGGVAGNNNQDIAAQLEAESTKTANTTSPRATYKAELVTGTNRSDYLMRKLTIEAEDCHKLEPPILIV